MGNKMHLNTQLRDCYTGDPEYACIFFLRLSSKEKYKNSLILIEIETMSANSHDPQRIV